MINLNKNNSGFTTIEFLLVIATLAIIGTAGYFVANHVNAKKTPTATMSSTTPKTTTSAKSTTTTTTPRKIYLDDNKVSFDLPVGFEQIGGSVNNGLPCGQGATSPVTPCVDKTSIVLKTEGYISDGFYIEVSVFNNSKSQSAQDWFSSLGLEGTGGTGNTLTINGQSAYSYSIDPTVGDNSEVDDYYTITSTDTSVLVEADLFSGNHYSDMTTNNYLGYASTVESTAKTVNISN